MRLPIRGLARPFVISARRGTLAIIAAAAAALTAARAAPTEPSSGLLPLSPALLKARTVQVTVSEYTAYGDDKPLLTNNDLTNRFLVDIARPNRMRIRCIVRQGADATPPLVLLSDGVKQFEYFTLGDERQYAVSDAKPLGRFSDTFGVTSRYAYEVRAQFLAGLPATLRGWTYENDSNLIDGRVMRAYGSRRFRVGTWGGETQLLVDKETGLPRRIRVLRDTYAGGEKGSAFLRETEDSRLDFTDWRLNPPLPAATFQWSRPTGVKPTPASGPPRYTPLKVGTPAPDFTVSDADGRVVRLSSLRGKVVLIDFWGTWCGGCQLELPAIEDIARRYRSRNVVVLVMDIGEKSTTAFHEWRLLHPEFTAVRFVSVPGKSIHATTTLPRNYGVVGIPAQYVVDRRGRIAAYVEGFEAAQELEDAVQAATESATPARRR